MKLKNFSTNFSTWNKDYQQANLLLARESLVRDPGGVCFRLCFKWLACKIYNREFKFGHFPEEMTNFRKTIALWRIGVKKAKGITRTGLPQSGNITNRSHFKPASVIKKQNVYLKKIKSYEGVGKDYSQFRASVHRETLSTLELWGKKNQESFQNWDNNKKGKYGTSKYNLVWGYFGPTNTLPELQKAFVNHSKFIIGMFGTDPDTGPWAHAAAFYFRDEPSYFDPNGGEFDFDDNDDIVKVICSDIFRRYTSTTVNINDFILYYVKTQ